MARFVHPHFQKSRELLRGSYDFATSHHEDFTGKAGAAIQAEIDRHAARHSAGPERSAAEYGSRPCAERGADLGSALASLGSANLVQVYQVPIGPRWHRLLRPCACP